MWGYAQVSGWPRKPWLRSCGSSSVLAGGRRASGPDAWPPCPKRRSGLSSSPVRGLALQASTGLAPPAWHPPLWRRRPRGVCPAGESPAALPLHTHTHTPAGASPLARRPDVGERASVGWAHVRPLRRGAPSVERRGCAPPSQSIGWRGRRNARRRPPLGASQTSVRQRRRFEGGNVFVDGSQADILGVRAELAAGAKHSWLLCCGDAVIFGDQMGAISSLGCGDPLGCDGPVVCIQPMGCGRVG